MSAGGQQTTDSAHTGMAVLRECHAPFMSPDTSLRDLEFHRLLYSVRGPEWAVAVQQGDLDALSDVMRRCSLFWNGSGTLIVPVRRDGRVDRALARLTAVVNPERCFVHESVDDRGSETLRNWFTDVVPLWPEFDAHEVHPLYFAPVPDLAGGDAKPRLDVPVFRSAKLQRIALACWGHLVEGDRAYWEERFDVRACDTDDLAGRALVEGQTEVGSTSPIRLTARHMRIVSWQSPQDWPYVILLGDGSFDELVRFWNFRARSGPIGGRGAAVVGLPYQLLRTPSALASLHQWLAPDPGTRVTPNVLINCRPEKLGSLETALQGIGFVEEQGTKLSRSWGRSVEAQESITYLPARLVLGGRMSRGSIETALVPLTRKMSLALDPPEDFDLRTGRFVRLTLLNLPLALPLTASAARRMHPQGVDSDGLLITFGASRRYSFDVDLPLPGDALTDWAIDNGFQARPTQDSRYADALLGRLSSEASLDALASEARLRLLTELAPRSRKKLAQRLRIELERDGTSLDVDALAEKLKGGGVALQLEAWPAQAVATKANLTRVEALRALEPLVREGFVVRGHVVECPTCHTSEFLRLDELAEQVRCRSCRTTFVLPVTDASGDLEPGLSYRVDGLMGRVMDQDVLPVLLAYRHVRRSLRSGQNVAGWLGVEFAKDGFAVDVDLLAYNGQHIYCIECKRNASTLTDAQLKRVVEFADAVGAIPGIASLAGKVSAWQRALLEQHSGVVFGADQLLSET